MQNATTHRELNAYAGPDTGLAPLLSLPPGRYPILELREHFPDPDSDFAKLEVPDAPEGHAWICTRWTHRSYATVSDDASDLLQVSESALVGLLPEFHGYGYSLTQPRYPFSIPGLPDALLEPPAVNNCCTFVEALLVRAWQTVHGSAFEWNAARHAQMMVADLADVFSPVTSVVEARMASASDAAALPEPWTIVQGWKRSPDDDGSTKWSGGHTFIILDCHVTTRRILTLESNDFFGMHGPGFRAIGDLDDFPGQHPGRDWHNRSGLWTWADFHRVYRHMQLAKLAVRDVRWISGD